MAMAPEEDKRYNCDGAMDDNSNKQCKAKEIKVGTSGGTSNPWKATANSQNPSSC